MIIKYLLKYLKDIIRLRFNTNGNSKFGKLIYRKIKKGIYLDIGCYHPIKESQTAFLYKNGWRGTNVDISKETIDMFKLFRSKDLNLNLGVSTKSGKANAYFEKKISAVSSLDKNYLNKIGRSNKIQETIKVLTISDLRKKYNLKKIDFIKIDCESIDESIIMSSNFKDLDCKYLSLELLPQTHYGWKNYKLPEKNLDNYFREYFFKSKVYKKLKEFFVFYSNDEYSFLLKKIEK